MIFYNRKYINYNESFIIHIYVLDIKIRGLYVATIALFFHVMEKSWQKKKKNKNKNKLSFFVKILK